VFFCESSVFFIMKSSDFP